MHTSAKYHSFDFVFTIVTERVPNASAHPTALAGGAADGDEFEALMIITIEKKAVGLQVLSGKVLTLTPRCLARRARADIFAFTEAEGKRK